MDSKSKIFTQEKSKNVCQAGSNSQQFRPLKISREQKRIQAIIGPYWITRIKREAASRVKSQKTNNGRSKVSIEIKIKKKKKTVREKTKKSVLVSTSQ